MELTTENVRRFTVTLTEEEANDLYINIGDIFREERRPGTKALWEKLDSVLYPF